ncbi:MAG: hypothetical protein JNL39_12415, partial [Opitutaceae bacterium]|nr:hypothetical protein [Opitutaceae bacterium]
CTWSGLAVEEWLGRRLIQTIIPAQTMTLAHDMPVDEFVRLARPAGCEVVGSLYGRGGYSWEFSPRHDAAAYTAEVSRTPTPAQFLGAALNQRHLGASGHQIYNYLLHTDEAASRALTSSQGPRRHQVTPAYFHDREDSYEYRKQLPVALIVGQPAMLRVLVGDLPPGAPAYLRLGLSGANRDYGATAINVRVGARVLHAGPAGSFLVVADGKRHGNGSHPPPTEAYVQWPLREPGLLREGWNAIAVTVTASAKPLQLVEAEIALGW